MLRIQGLLMFIALAAPGWVVAQGSYSIGLFADATCSTCNLAIPIGETRDIYVASQAQDLILGAEFRVVGLPEGWSYVAIPAPGANVVLGDPMGPVGANIAFPSGFPPGCAILYRIIILATTAVSNVGLQVVPRNPPTNPTYECPRLIPDCSPCFVFICAEGGHMTINGEGDCLLPIAPVTWGSVKSTYR